MKLPSLLLIASLSCCSALAEEKCHFHRVDIPPNEVRLMELARIQEFRCDCELPRVDPDSQFIVERYQHGNCVSRQWFSMAKYDSRPGETYKGTISFGWHMDDQKLVGIHDTGFWHRPSFLKLPAFDPYVSLFYKDSLAEMRTSKSSLHTELYPIIGIRGTTPRKLSGVTIEGRIGDISALPQEKLSAFFKNSPDAIIVYLSFGPGLPDLGFDKTETKHADKTEGK